ncbi:TIGR01906 family membrane protein [Clostridium akagii]|uniref:TIGR01906 family membrane protein n=1 Tax=Clostridium akagii TaxID=91623 RepID=UPI0024183FBA|nr:TIGR01906 family membrane protein [Clostridium akagii]
MLVMFTITFSTKIVYNFKPLYYYDIVNLNIEETSNLSLTSIKSNYNYIIDYLNENNTHEFKLPSLPSSKDAITHFSQVKNVFKILNYIFYFSMLLLILVIIITTKLKQFLYLKISSILILAMPILLLPLSLINFDTTFTLFHKIIFHNSLWLFNPEKDPVILMLPQNFFMHCFIFIILLNFLCGLLYILIYKMTLKNSQ